MPKKTSARRPCKSPAVAKIRVGVEDPIPSAVVDYIAALPASVEIEALNNEEPFAKRRKITVEPYSPICVAKARLRFSRAYSDGDTPPFAASCEDAGRYLKFTLRHGLLSMTSRPAGPQGSFSICFLLDGDEIGEEATRILGIGGANSKRDNPGDIWVAVATSIILHDKVVTIQVSLSLNWNETPSPYYPLPNSNDRKLTRQLIDSIFPDNKNEDLSAWSPMDFYEAAHVPPKDDKAAVGIDIPGLGSELFPYQKRTLQWLLAREGVRWSHAKARLESTPVDGRSPSIDSFRTVKDADGRSIFLSDVFQTITRDKSLYERADRFVKGGILAEEMGLGKTLEILGLILLHSRAESQAQQIELQMNGLATTGATLIVTPDSLRQQWISEMERHAPSLRVKHYQGCKKMRDGDEEAIIDELCGYDVVITTYSALSAELHFAFEPPERSRRYERAYPRTTSPLVKIAWWRLCLDEAQMIENGYSQAASVARVLPRVNAWGITGTPVKDDVKDLFGLLLFLRYEPYCSATQVWQALTTNHKSLFRQIFNSISLRHTKTLVRDEILLPAQKRFVISIPFTAVEEQHYQSLFKEMSDECGLETDGSPKTDDWDPEDYYDAMRLWLNRLRQTTLHPEVGIYNRRLLGYNKSRPMRTVDEVLAAMLEQNENTIRAEERAYLLSRLARGQMYENSPRVKEALVLWEDVRQETEKLVSDARTRLKDAIREHGGEAAVKKAEEEDHVRDLSSTDDDEQDELGARGKIGECRRRLRSALELHHKAVFFCANAYFQIRDNKELTEPNSEEFQKLKKLEDDGYNAAKALRREILGESNRKARRLMNSVARKARTRTFVDIPELATIPERGIESGRIVDGLELLYGELNEQADVIDRWREEVVQLLLKPLVDEDDDVETTGEELGESAKFQDLLMVYVTTLRAAIADRSDAISGQTNELAKHETETSLRLARAGEGPAPVKMSQMLCLRAEIKPKMANLSMRGAVSEFRGLQSRLSRDTAASSREAVEAKIASDQLRATQSQINTQNKVAMALESEIESFKATMNARLEYYRQLQVVSDAVLPLEGAKDDNAINKLKQTEDELRRKLSSAEAKHRYLLNLKEAGTKSNEPRMCVICQMPFVTGVLTVCGHQFCKECMTMWFKAHHNCPVCKRSLKPSNLHDIAIKPQQLQVHSEGINDQGCAPQRRVASNPPKKAAIYSEFNANKLAEIKNVELDGPSFTSKVDTLVRHLLWLRESDPGAKSIVFSQYRDFLHILRNAFRRFRIGHASIDDVNGIASFKEDPATEVFLLHARAHSSGLNLVNASHVFLYEPLLNTALELQAIARVDRIGQQHETTVWLYLVSGTVEESIYNLSVRRRMEHMGRRGISAKERATPELLDANIEAANTLELEQAALSKLMSKDKSAGEMVDKGDLWECLFGHVGTGDGGGQRDCRLQEKAVMSYLAGEAAARRRAA
ncbi:SNF2-related protein [Metarhizium album ARSEF 1941]|uniref:SNF2-related protein n=1 Tax=Metarhizium album (strain ARSEF 1941) TaxID=1081103 RepID=A0A0B2WN68_METAS|nr:SNF2-related protein [Metarhizium album ARSEF 1941]KHN95378.1 SNF2-related protein [Metarhizium album ARSEF 1941]